MVTSADSYVQSLIGVKTKCYLSLNYSSIAVFLIGSCCATLKAVRLSALSLGE